jgi:hypothetical protein
MKRSTVIIVFLFCFSAFRNSRIFSATYEASTLHNAVARSETVLDLFHDRWNRIEEMELYFDWYGKINWVDDFKVYAINAATGERETVNMTLVRTYGSITINYPILGGYEGADIRERLKYGTGKYKKEEEEGGLWKPKSLIIGFTATGFHYGLTRESTVDRGSAGSETITDYKYTQFFDDIFAGSLLYRPYFFVHAGIIINNQIEPNDDGTMDYGNSTNRTKRYFIATNILSFLNINAMRSEDEIESIAAGIIVNNLMNFIVEKINPAIPVLTITFKSLNLFNDEPYDAVWVKTVKAPTITDEEKDSAALYTLSFLINENLYNYVYLDFYAEFQQATETLIEKKTGEKIDYAKLRQINGMIGFNFWGDKKGEMLVASVGLSRYWDVAIPYNRESGDAYYVYGYLFSIESRFFVWGGIPLGIELKASKNYAPELRKLVETTDKYALEMSVYISF